MIDEFSAAVEDLAWLIGVAFLAGVAALLISKRRGANARTTISLLSTTLLVVALAGVAYVTLTPVGGVGDRPGSNLDLFARVDARNVVANIGLFAPLGFLSRIAWMDARRPAARALILCLATSLSVEGSQWAVGLGRSADIQDLALNTIGGLLGIIAGSVVLRTAVGLPISPAPE